MDASAPPKYVVRYLLEYNSIGMSYRLLLGLRLTVDPAAVVDWLSARGVQSEVVGSPVAGLQRLAQRPAVRLVVGSFYLVGEARTALARQRGRAAVDKPHPD